jgi:transposase
MDEVDDADLVVELVAALHLGKAALEACVCPTSSGSAADGGAARFGTTTAQLLAMVGWLRLWRVQRAI